MGLWLYSQSKMAKKQKQDLVHDPVELAPVHIALNHIHLLHQRTAYLFLTLKEHYHGHLTTQYLAS